MPLPAVTAEQEREGIDAHKKALMPRKHRKVYESFQRRKQADRERVAELEGKRAKLAAGQKAAKPAGVASGAVAKPGKQARTKQAKVRQ